jgi:Acyl-CoA dehydrogenase, N-terminal domain.
MNLNYGPEYEDFTKEVQKFCKEYSGVTITNKKGGALTSLSSITNSDKSDGVKLSRSEWQKILIKNGYFARSIPKEYGGFGGDIDIIKNRIKAAEFASNRIPPPIGVKA